MELTESLATVTETLWPIKTKEDLQYVLEDLLTPAEITGLGERINILQLLRSGKNQRDIAEDLGVSITTVSRGNRVLQYGRKVISTYLT